MDRVEPRMFAIACANEDADCPINVQKIELPKGMTDQLKAKLETEFGKEGVGHVKKKSCKSRSGLTGV